MLNPPFQSAQDYLIKPPCFFVLVAHQNAAVLGPSPNIYAFYLP